MAASNRLDRRKNLSPLCISSFINQGLAPWRRKRGRGLQAADAGGLAPYHPWGLPRPVPLGRGWRPSRTTAQPLAAGFTSPVKSAERRSFGARLCRLTDAASPLRGKGAFGAATKQSAPKSPPCQRGEGRRTQSGGGGIPPPAIRSYAAVPAKIHAWAGFLGAGNRFRRIISRNWNIMGLQPTPRRGAA